MNIKHIKFEAAIAQLMYATLPTPVEKPFEASPIIGSSDNQVVIFGIITANVREVGSKTVISEDKGKNSFLYLYAIDGMLFLNKRERPYAGYGTVCISLADKTTAPGQWKILML